MILDINHIIKQTEIAPFPFPMCIPIDLTEQQKKEFNSIIELYDKDPSVKALSNNNFITKLDSYTAISKAKSWWNSIKPAISLTSVGKVIAHTNAKSIDNTLPDMD